MIDIQRRIRCWPPILTYSKMLSVQQLHGLLFKKASLSTCHLIDGAEGASLGSHCCSAPQYRQRAFCFNVLLVNFRHLHVLLFFFWSSLFEVQRLLSDITLLYKEPRCGCKGMHVESILWCRSASILGPPKESSSTSINCATQHKRLPLQLSLTAYYVFNESVTVFKRNRQVSEWQITPMHRQAQDDYHGKLTTG